MTISRFGRHAFTGCIAAAFLAGCGGSQSSNAIPLGSAVAPTRTAANGTSPANSYQTLHHFDGSDGAYPYGGLIEVNGALYGTTASGGSANDGTVYRISTAGAEKVVHSFAGSSDGANPGSGLINVNGILYGTTVRGGGVSRCSPYGCGTAYAVSTNGKEKVLHSFTGLSDGGNPEASLLNVRGTLYGTTFDGGADFHGTVFRLGTNGSEKVLHSFPSGSSDGYDPVAGLINMNGTLYGTTAEGGSGCLVYGCGTVYRISTSGEEKVVYVFTTFAEGVGPYAGLISVNGRLYGTTIEGGAAGDGTAYRVSTAGVEKVLHSFSYTPDGDYPNAGVINVKGTLYGTTLYGGAHHFGTIYSISTSGVETILHSFAGGSDGANPAGGLINVNGTLYGTTSGGGARRDGTIFALTP